METYYRDKTVLVTGAAGLLGARVARSLLGEGATVRALVRVGEKANFLKELGAVVLEWATGETPVAPEAVEGCDYVFHLAETLNESKPISHYRTVNVEGTRLVAEAALDAKVPRFLHSSTAWVYGMGAGPGISEDAPLVHSGHAYADTKLEAEQLVRDMAATRGLRAVIVQPSQVYGPYGRAWTLRHIDLLQRRLFMLPDKGRGLVQPIYVDDAAEGCMLAAAHGRAGESYLLCGKQTVTMAQYVEHLRAIAHTPKPRSVPAWFAGLAASVVEIVSRATGRPSPFTATDMCAFGMRATYNIGKAARELGFVPTISLEAGMRSVKSWMESERISPGFSQAAGL